MAGTLTLDDLRRDGLVTTYPSHSSIDCDLVDGRRYTNHRCSRCGAPVVNVLSARLWAAAGKEIEPKFDRPCEVRMVPGSER